MKEEIIRHYRAAYQMLLVETHEELRLQNHMREAYKDAVTRNNETLLLDWQCTHGLGVWDNENEHFVSLQEAIKGDLQEVFEEAASNIDPSQLDNFTDLTVFLRHVDAPFILMAYDAHAHIAGDAFCIRSLRYLANVMKSKRQMIVFSSPEFKVPTELQKDIMTLDFKLPGPDDLGDLFDALVESIDPDMEVNPADRDNVIQAASGLTRNEAENAMAYSAIEVKDSTGEFTTGSDYAHAVFGQKVNTLKSNETLDYKKPRFNFESIGGMENLKEFVMKRSVGFGEDARKFGLPTPKGVILVGPPGTGKTAISSAIADALDMPMFECLLDALYGSKVGESEQRTREMIRLLDGIGKAVILMDEAEKYLSESATSGQGDSGTSSRVFGRLLSWMNDRTCPVYIVATVNSVSKLPAPLIRPGRFDSVFVVQRPNEAERASIVRALWNYQFNIDTVISETAVEDIVKASDGMTGAELYQCLLDALYDHLNSGSTDLKLVQERFLSRVKVYKPQSRNESEAEKKEFEKLLVKYPSASAVAKAKGRKEGKRALEV